ncbi:hypothetical protein LJC64_04880 [Ruminococcaceae bacterium OttesenSCG-928-A11]|nr:hypothetical protein [Ruminococcaceae bacterium OttesenSCG-928-A11]
MEFDRAKMLEEHAKAAVNLYGVIPLDEWAAIFSEHHGDHVTENDIAFLRGRSGPSFYIHEGDLVQFSLGHDAFSGIAPLKAQTQGKPRYIPERDEFLKHAVLGYFEWTPQIGEVDAFVRGKMGLDGESAKGMVDQVALLCMSGAEIREMLPVLTDRVQSDEQLFDLLPLVSEVHNHTRLWINKGHTPDELMEMQYS